MIGPVTYVDLVVMGVPILIGLIFMWRGVGRSLLSIPVRVIVSLLVGWVASSAAAVYLEVNQAALPEIGGSRLMTLLGIRAAVFVIVFAVLIVVMGRIRAHLVGDDANVHVDALDRTVRFAVGALTGLVVTLLVAVPNYMFYESFSSDPNQQPDMLRRSVSLPLIKYASDAMRPILQRVIPRI